MYRKLLIGIMFLLMINIVMSDTIKYNITHADDDWYWSNQDGIHTGTTTLSIINSKAIFGLTIIQYGYTDINTSLIPDGNIINSANYSFYNDDYTVTGRPRPSKNVILYINNNSNWQLVGALNSIPTGWNTINLDSLVTLINKSGLTSFRIIVPEVNLRQVRSMDVRAYEYGSDYSAYLNISHSTTTTTTTTTSTTTTTTGYCNGKYSGTGDWVISEPTICNNENIPIDGNLIVNYPLRWNGINATISWLNKYVWINYSAYFYFNSSWLT